MSENTTDNANQERRVGPSVSRDKWAQHVKQKMAKGYMLIVAADKRRANFWMRDKGYEMCAYDTARSLVASGEVIPAGEHHLGTIYELAAMPAPAPAKKAKAPKAPKPEPTPDEPVVLPIDADAPDDDTDDGLDTDDLGDEEEADDADDGLDADDPDADADDADDDL